MQAKEFKVMVLGPRCGKTTFIRQVQGKPPRHTSRTTGASVTPYDFCLGGGRYRLNFWEVGSKYPGLGKQYGTGMDLAIIFVDGSGDRLCYDKWVPASVPCVYVHRYKLSDTQRILQHAIRLLVIRSKL